MQRRLGTLMVVLAAGLLVTPALATVNVTVGPTSGLGPASEPWLGFMNVFELPANGGGFVFASAWGVPDLSASFDGVSDTVTMGATPLDDPNEFWYQGVGNPGGPGVPGNKNMEANLYQEFPAGAVSGDTLVFEGTVISNTLNDSPDRDTFIFIKDFASDYSSFNGIVIPAPDSGPFSLSLAVDPGLEGTRHLQYGFTNLGPNVWSTDVAAQGTVVYGPVPEPASFALLALGGMLIGRRRK
jgi:hypothetical protein